MYLSKTPSKANLLLQNRVHKVYINIYIRLITWPTLKEGRAKPRQIDLKLSKKLELLTLEMEPSEFLKKYGKTLDRLEKRYL